MHCVPSCRIRQPIADSMPRVSVCQKTAICVSATQITNLSGPKRTVAVSKQTTRKVMRQSACWTHIELSVFPAVFSLRVVDLPVHTILVHHACTVGLRSPVQCLSAVPIFCVWARHSSNVTHEASHGTHAFARTLVMDMDNGKAHSLGGVDYKTFRVHLHLQGGATDVYAVYGNEKHPLVRAHTKTTACMHVCHGCLLETTYSSRDPQVPALLDC